MLNIGSIGSAGSTAEYHTAKESQDAREEYQGTTLEGELAKRLGIEGEIDAQALTELYEGNIPEPEQSPAEPEAQDVEIGEDPGTQGDEAREAVQEAEELAPEQSPNEVTEASQDAPAEPEEPSSEEPPASGPETPERGGQGERTEAEFDADLIDLPDLPAKSDSAPDRRNGDEIIISVPKSVSVLAITYGDNRLMDAVRE
ncbi:MAG: relaxase domain-containing protein, partial [Betaproteobacteria bacterium]|nr:relaxase domain-containing protein [Betaproteobacteria bacterium]